MNLKAVVVGVGPETGLGGALCKRFAEEGHHVFIAGRSAQKLDSLAEKINDAGGQATPVTCDATDEQSVIGLFDSIENESEGRLDLVVYNVGNSTPGNIRDMERSISLKLGKCFVTVVFWWVEKAFAACCRVRVR